MIRFPFGKASASNWLARLDFSPNARTSCYYYPCSPHSAFPSFAAGQVQRGRMWAGSSSLERRQKPVP